MGSFLVMIFFFARPMMFMDSGLHFGGLNFFELLTIIFTGVLGLVAFTNVFIGRKIGVSATEWLIIAFLIWCSSIAIIYPEDSDLKSYAKLVLPPLSLIILRRAMWNREQYLRSLKWLILGFALPVFLSAILISQGKGLFDTIYWTGLERYSGAYANNHNMGHSMGFLLILITVYITLVIIHKDSITVKLTWAKYGFFLLLAGTASYCLYYSQVRTVFIGLLVFFLIALFSYSKKWFALFLLLVSISVITLAPLYSKIFFDVVEAYEGQREIEQAASGRPYIWDHNLSIYSELSIDRKLAGVGIGNTISNRNRNFSGRKAIGNVWESHNDFLTLLMETGAVGLVLMSLMYSFILAAILKLRGRGKYVFLAFFGSVMIMNFVSNSYITRFGMAQMLFMIMTYVWLPGNTRRESPVNNVRTEHAPLRMRSQP
jgi:O-antigen ligase